MKQMTGKVYRKIALYSHLHRQISQEIHFESHHTKLSEPFETMNSVRKERDPIVKLVVACCFSEFHITAIFDDLDRRFMHRPPFIRKYERM